MSVFRLFDDDVELKNNRVYGVVIGIVTNLDDPDGLGRVKVKIPTRSDEYETTWARVTTPMAGSSMGIFFMPEVDEEVLLAFHEGNINQPIVIGRLWSSQSKPPASSTSDYFAGGKVKMRKIKTGGGSELIFDEESGKEKITLKTKAGAQILMDDENKKIEIKDSSGNNKVNIDGNGSTVSIDANTKVVIKVSSTTLTLQGTSVEIKSGGTLNIKGAMVEIKADSKMTLDGGGMMEIKGGIVKIN